jgi:hypothetical protein
VINIDNQLVNISISYKMVTFAPFTGSGKLKGR